MNSLRLDDISFRYAGAAADALHGVTLEFSAGNVAWLTGALGAGCSTLLLVAAGLAPRHTGGELQGEISPRGNAGEVVAYVTGTPMLQLSGVAATVWEEVAFAPANLGWPIERIRGAVSGALERLGVAALAERDPATLSGGELQRVVLSAMLALAPDLWLLDEPASALDREGRRILDDLLRAEAARGAIVVIASEDADAMMSLADRLIVLDRGTVALDGEPRDLLAGESIWRAGAASTSIAALARAAGALAGPTPRLVPPYPLTVANAVARWT